MEFLLFAVYDEKAKAFTQPPFTAVATGVAIRMFTDAVGDKNTELGRHPGDFTLYALGSLSKVDGVIRSEVSALGSGLTFQVRE